MTLKFYISCEAAETDGIKESKNRYIREEIQL